MRTPKSRRWPTTPHKLLAVMAQLDYRPNAQARSLRLGSKASIGLLLENKIGDNDYDDLFIVTTTDTQTSAVRLKYGEPSVSPTR